MSNTFSQLQFHIVFAVKYRDAIIADEWRDELFSYIAGIIKNHGHNPIAIGGYYDHVHILIGCRPTINIPILVKNIKLATNQWIQPKFKCKFAWQDGYGVFTISKSHEKAVVQYIYNQQEHHSKIGMVDEFKRLLDVNGVGYEERYLPEKIFDQ